MKNLSFIINAVLAIAIGILFFLHFRDCKTPTMQTSSAASTNNTAPGTLIAYVDMDSLEANFLYYKDKKTAFEKEQKSLETSLMSGQESLQREAYAFQQKAQTMTQSEGEQAQQALMEKKNKLEQQRDEGAQRLQGEMSAITLEVYSKIDSVVKDYNRDHKYAYILSYAKGGSILYKDKALDITPDVVALLNKMSPSVSTDKK